MITCSKLLVPNYWKQITQARCYVRCWEKYHFQALTCHGFPIVNALWEISVRCGYFFGYTAKHYCEVTVQFNWVLVLVVNTCIVQPQTMWPSIYCSPCFRGWALMKCLELSMQWNVEVKKPNTRTNRHDSWNRDE